MRGEEDKAKAKPGDLRAETTRIVSLTAESYIRDRLMRYHVDTERFDRSIGCPIGPRGEAIYVTGWQRDEGTRYARERAGKLRIHEATRADREWVSQFSFEALVAILGETQ